jgi:TPR repeat protein
MITIQKEYWFFAAFSVLTITLIYILGFFPLYLTSKQIIEFHGLATKGDATAMSKLISYYYLIEKDTNKTVDIFRQYKNVSMEFKMGFYDFLKGRNLGYKSEIISLATELANEGNYYIQIDLANFYTNGRFVEKDLQKAEYWTKISKCNKKGISIQECEEKLKQ